MEVTVFASGSTGNCTLVRAGGTLVLIDLGISFLKLRTALSRLELTPEALDGVLITHEHADHIKGLQTLLRRTALPVFAPSGVASRLRVLLPEAVGRVQTVPTDAPFSWNSLTVAAFETPHDTPQSVGYRIAAGAETFCLCTDLGHVPESVFAALAGADAVLIESNHDLELLRNGRYPPMLKRRILSDRGHLSNADCASLAVRLAETGTRSFLLGHLSRENNTPELALRAVTSALAAAGYDDVSVAVAPIEGSLTIRVKGGSPCCT